jgi:phage-related minor tail protein
MAAMAAVLAAGLGEVKAIGKGFDTGGYTGDGNPTDVAGVVHGGEFVFSAPAVKNIGRENLDALHRGGAMRPSWGGGGPGPARRSNPIQVHLHNYTDPVQQLKAAGRQRDGHQFLTDISTGAIKAYKK